MHRKPRVLLPALLLLAILVAHTAGTARHALATPEPGDWDPDAPQPVTHVGMLLNLTAMRQHRDRRAPVAPDEQQPQPPAPRWRLIRHNGPALELALPPQNEAITQTAQQRHGRYVEVRGYVGGAYNDDGLQTMLVEELKAAEPVTFEWDGHLHNLDVGYDVTSRPGMVFVTGEGDERRRLAVAGSDVELTRWTDREDGIRGQASPRLRVTAYYALRHYSGWSERASQHLSWSVLGIYIKAVQEVAGDEADERENNENSEDSENNENNENNENGEGAGREANPSPQEES